MYNNKSKIYLPFLFFASLLFSACNSTRNLVYFSDLKVNDAYKAAERNDAELKIQSNDLLNIQLSSLNTESNSLFNVGTLPTAPGASGQTSLVEGYLVDKNGDIDFPVLGRVKLTGLTKEEAVAKMTNAIGAYVKSPIVTIRLLNFKVTVIGEVNKPSSFTVPNERINILEALGLAGDMTPYGKRENVLLIRETDNVRSTTRLNLNDKATLASPYFYLQQNDVVYVEPDKLKQVQASTNPRTLTIATMSISVLVALIFNYQNIF